MYYTTFQRPFVLELEDCKIKCGYLKGLGCSFACGQWSLLRWLNLESTGSAIAERRWTAAGSIRPRRRPGWRSTGRCTSGPPGTRSPSPSATVPSTCLPSSAGWSVSVPLFPPTTDAVMFSSCNTFNCRKLKWLSFDLIISDSWFVGSGRRDLYINLNTTKKSWSCYQVNKK